MSLPAIQVENLSKAYRIGLREEIPDTLTSAVLGWVRRPLQNFQRLKRLNTFGRNGHADSEDTIWALRDVSFDVAEGEVLGVIGRNGAGKSTLLKMLSRITEPTSGRAVIRGRVSSLLEVGTGFHPELTGRENIYMNGTVLGMTKREIDRKFDEIVDFSGVERFLDTPVKRYSSGMQVRLAFSVAAHLEPEILIVDEVLAVGDAEFQKKCIGKMQTVALGGRTVLFVSHNMGAVQRLCTRATMLANGRILADGSTETVVAKYLSLDQSPVQCGRWLDLTGSTRCGSTLAQFTAVRFNVPNSKSDDRLTPGSAIDFDLVIDSKSTHKVSSIAVTFYDRHGTKLVNADSLSIGKVVHLKQGRNELCVRIDGVYLNPGSYDIGLWLANPPMILDHIQPAFRIEIAEREENGYGRRPSGDGLVSCKFHLVD